MNRQALLALCIFTTLGCAGPRGGDLATLRATGCLVFDPGGGRLEAFDFASRQTQVIHVADDQRFAFFHPQRGANGRGIWISGPSPMRVDVDGRVLGQQSSGGEYPRWEFPSPNGEFVAHAEGIHATDRKSVV